MEFLYHHSCFRKIKIKIKIKIKQFQIFFFLRGKESHLQLIRGSSLPHFYFSSFSKMNHVSCNHINCFRKCHLTNSQEKASSSLILFYHKLYFFFLKIADVKSFFLFFLNIKIPKYGTSLLIQNCCLI